MAYEANIAENVEWMEVFNGEEFDQPRIDPWQIEEFLKNKVRQELKETLESYAQWEADQQIGALRYERGVIGRQDYRNGHRARSLSTTMGTVELMVPRARYTALSFNVFERYRRRWREMDQLLLEAFIGGASCRQVGTRMAGLLGGGVSGATVAKLKEELIDRLKRFKNEPLADEYVALIIDGMYVRIKQCGERKRPVVAVVGIKANGEKQLLSIRVCYSENSLEVEGMLKNLKQRGLHGVNLSVVTLDGDKGLESAVLAVYGNVRIQDCIFHRINRLHQNAESKKRGRVMMKESSKAFAEENPGKQRKALNKFCDKWRGQEPHAIKRFEHDLYKCFEVNALPGHLRKKASTTSLCEGLFKQIRSRINSIGAFENPLSAELFVYAIVCQKSWLKTQGRPDAAPLLQPFTHFS